MDAMSPPEVQPCGWGGLCFQSARTKHVGAARESRQPRLAEPRNILLGVNRHIGALCNCLRRSAKECAAGLSGFSSLERDIFVLELGSAFALLLVLADQCNVDLPLAVSRKIDLNSKKYPPALVRGSALKYDAYQEHTGFAKGSKQVTTDGHDGEAHLMGHKGREWSSRTFEDLRIQLQRFAQDRGWEKFHTPRNICLALSGEAGELCELFQFKDEYTCAPGLPGWTEEARDKVAQELSDVSIYLCRLADVCGVNLPEILQDERLIHYYRGTQPKTQDSAHEWQKTNRFESWGADGRWGYLAACLMLGLVVVTSWAQRSQLVGIRGLP